MPSLQGLVKSWASVELIFAAIKSRGHRDIKWDETLEGELVYASGIAPVGYTTGVYTPPKLTIQFLADDWVNQFRPALAVIGGGAVGRGFFPIQLKLFEVPLGISVPDPIRSLPIIDTFGQCRVTKEGRPHSQGAGALVVDVDIQTLDHKCNGLSLWQSALDLL